jgi:hypothetical protein
MHLQAEQDAAMTESQTERAVRVRAEKEARQAKKVALTPRQVALTILRKRINAGPVLLSEVAIARGVERVAPSVVEKVQGHLDKLLDRYNAKIDKSLGGAK